MQFKKILKKTWHFIWHENSLLSWIVNIILAFIIVKFVIYPLIGLLLSTSYPIVAVVSGSMEHDNINFNEWWASNKDFYLKNEFTKSQFQQSPFPNGFNKGDIIVLKGTEPKDIKIGHVIVYKNQQYTNPIIHRVVKKYTKNNNYYFQTKGDHNSQPDSEINENQIIGKAIFRVPYLGWIKIWFTQLINLAR